MNEGIKGDTLGLQDQIIRKDERGRGKQFEEIKNVEGSHSFYT